MLIDFLANDERAKEAARILSRDRRNTVRSGFLFSSSDAPPDLLLLPIPATRDGISLNDTPYSLEIFQKRLSQTEKKPRLIGYGACPDILAFSDYLDLSKDEKFVSANAELTAEGGLYLLQKALCRQGLSLSETVAVILGYGRIARAIAARLAANHAQILIGARRKDAREAAQSAGYLPFDCTDRTFFLERGRLLFADRAHILINTVPERSVIELTKKMPSPLFALELSGKSDVLEACQALPYPTIDGKAIPTRFLPQTAGKLLAEAILRAL